MEMPSIPQLTSGSTTIKDYLSRKEKGLGLISTIAIGAALVYFLGPIVGPQMSSALGWLNTIANQTVALAIKVGLIAIGAFIVMQPRVWTLGWHIFNAFSKTISMALIRMNPTDRAEAYANEYLGGRKEKLNRAATRFTAIRKQREKTIAEYKEKIEEARTGAEALKKRYYKDGRWSDEQKSAEFRVLSADYNMRTQSLKKFEAQLELLKKREAIIQKFVQAYDFWIRIIRLSVELLANEYKAMSEMAEATQIISGTVGEGNDQSKFFKMTMGYMTERIAGMDAQVEQFMQATPEFTGGFDLASDIAEDRMMEELARMDSIDATATTALSEAEQEERLLTEGGAQHLVSAMSTQREPALVPARRYGNLLNKKDDQR